MKKGTHPANVQRIGWKNVEGIRGPVPVWADSCSDCGRPVREMFHLSNHGTRHVFYHAAGKAAPGDPRRQTPRRPEWSRAISEGMKAATARRAARREEEGTL